MRNANTNFKYTKSILEKFLENISILAKRNKKSSYNIMSQNAENNDNTIWSDTVTFDLGGGDDLAQFTQDLTNVVTNALNRTIVNNNTNSTSDIETISISDEFDCSICKELLCEPIILMCQHSFCFDCIERHNNKNKKTGPLFPQQPRNIYNPDDTQIRESSLCPICRFPFTLPPRYNQEFENLLSYQFPEEYKERKDMISVNKQRDELEDKMRREVWNMINKNPPSQDSPLFQKRQLFYPPMNEFALEPQEKQTGVFGKLLSSTIFQGILVTTISIPCSLYLSKIFGLWSN